MYIKIRIAATCSKNSLLFYASLSVYEYTAHIHGIIQGSLLVVRLIPLRIIAKSI